MTIVKFAKFLTTKEFEDWQKQEPRNIHTVMPIAFSLNASTPEEVLTSFGCFVTYMVEEPQ